LLKHLVALFLFGARESGQQQRGQYGDDGNHHQQLNESKAKLHFIRLAKVSLGA
jgi:hypothetical protein